MAPSIPQLLLLAGVAAVAGTVDAMAGGGGLLTVPALLAVGLPPHLALGTNKGQSTFGAGAALYRYARHGWVNGRQALRTFPAGFLGGLLGAALLSRLRPEPLRPVVLVLLIAVGLFLAFHHRPRGPRGPGLTRAWTDTLTVLASVLIGIYDGFFGPGTGAFLIIAFMLLASAPLTLASADAKVVNFAANLAAFLSFIHRGTVVWPFALVMIPGQLVGGLLGAHLAVRGGERWVRRAVLVVMTALVVKVAHDLYGSV